jgi:hypothetical protein
VTRRWVPSSSGFNTLQRRPQGFHRDRKRTFGLLPENLLASNPTLMIEIVWNVAQQWALSKPGSKMDEDEEVIEGTVVLEDILGGVVAGPQAASVQFAQVRGHWVARFLTTHTLKWPQGRSSGLRLLFKDKLDRAFLRVPIPLRQDVVLGPKIPTSLIQDNGVQRSA